MSLTTLYARKLNFFFSSPLLGENGTAMPPLDIRKEMMCLQAVPFVASLDRIRDSAVAREFIHISCHTKGAHFVFEEKGESHLVAQDQLIEALDGAWFVFLAACDTWTCVEKLPKTIPFAIGTVGRVKDSELRLFAQCFYKELSSHRICRLP